MLPLDPENPPESERFRGPATSPGATAQKLEKFDAGQSLGRRFIGKLAKWKLFYPAGVPFDGSRHGGRIYSYFAAAEAVMTDALLYVSKSLVPPQDAEAEVERIVTLSLARNAKLDVTGALISTPHYFAQVLEGPAPALAELMTSISRDPRHTDIRIVDTRTSVGRRFPNWGMAYSGYAAYVDARIRPFFDGRHIVDAVHSSRELTQLMREFTK